VAPESSLKRYFDLAAASGQRRPLAAALRLAEQKHAVVAGFRMPDEFARSLRREPLPPAVAFLKR